MSNTYPPNTAPPGSNNDGVSADGSPGEQAARVGDTAAAAGHRVADVSKDEASKVASEAKKQASEVLAEARTQLSDQAAEQQARVASGLQAISAELTEMVRAKSEAGDGDEGGVASDLVQQAAKRAGSAASWLEARDPGSLLQEVRSFARRKPGTFIALAATAGVIAGRLTRSMVSNESGPDSGPAHSAPSADHRASGVSAPMPPPAAPVGGGFGAGGLGASEPGFDDLNADPDFQRGGGLGTGPGQRGVDGLGGHR